MNFIEIYDNALTPEACKKIIDFFDFAPPEIKNRGETFLTQSNLGVNKNVKEPRSKSAKTTNVTAQYTLAAKILPQETKR